MRTTASPTRRTAIALTAMVTATACGGGDTTDDVAVAASPGASSASPSAPAPALLSEADLQARLLTLEDLPTGFVVSEPTAADEEEPGLVSSDPRCQAYLDASGSESTAPSAATAEFESPDTFEFLTEDVESYDGQDAQASFGEARTGLAACSTLTVEGLEGDITVQQQSFGADLGDDTVAVRMDGEVDLGDGQLAPFGGNIVAVRLENNVVAVTIISIGGQVVDTEQVVRAAVKKFRSER